MKILQVVHRSPKFRGGTEIYTFNLCKNLSNENEVYLFYATKEKRKNETLLCQNKITHIPLHTRHISQPFRKSEFVFTYKNKKVEDFFRLILERIKPDIVHFQHLLNLSTNLISICKKKKIPTILTLHDFWFLCPQICLLKTNGKTCNGPNVRSTNCLKCHVDNKLRILGKQYLVLNLLLKNKFFRKIFKIFLRLYYNGMFEKRNAFLKKILKEVNLLIAPSNFLKRKFVAHGVPKNQIILSNHGMDLEIFKNFKKKQSKKIRFGYAGAISPHKGLDTLIEAFNKIKNKNVELKIYGSYKSKFKYYETLCQKCKNPNIEFKGQYVDVKIPFSEIDILIVPSIWYENCPLVIQEAFITKTPVIASNIGALPEFVQDRKTGLLFKKGDPDDLYKKIQLIIKNPILIKEMQKNIPLVRSIKEQVKELEKIYGSFQQK